MPTNIQEIAEYLVTGGRSGSPANLSTNSFSSVMSKQILFTAEIDMVGESLVVLSRHNPSNPDYGIIPCRVPTSVADPAADLYTVASTNTTGTGLGLALNFSGIGYFPRSDANLARSATITTDYDQGCAVTSYYTSYSSLVQAGDKAFQGKKVMAAIDVNPEQDDFTEAGLFSISGGASGNFATGSILNKFAAVQLGSTETNYFAGTNVMQNAQKRMFRGPVARIPTGVDLFVPADASKQNILCASFKDLPPHVDSAIEYTAIFNLVTKADDWTDIYGLCSLGMSCFVVWGYVDGAGTLRQVRIETASVSTCTTGANPQVMLFTYTISDVVGVPNVGYPVFLLGLEIGYSSLALQPATQFNFLTSPEATNGGRDCSLSFKDKPFLSVQSNSASLNGGEGQLIEIITDYEGPYSMRRVVCFNAVPTSDTATIIGHHATSSPVPSSIRDPAMEIVEEIMGKSRALIGSAEEMETYSRLVGDPTRLVGMALDGDKHGLTTVGSMLSASPIAHRDSLLDSTIDKLPSLVSRAQLLSGGGPLTASSLSKAVGKAVKVARDLAPVAKLAWEGAKMFAAQRYSGPAMTATSRYSGPTSSLYASPSLQGACAYSSVREFIPLPSTRDLMLVGRMGSPESDWHEYAPHRDLPILHCSAAERDLQAHSTCCNCIDSVSLCCSSKNGVYGEPKMAKMPHCRTCSNAAVSVAKLAEFLELTPDQILQMTQDQKDAMEAALTAMNSIRPQSILRSSSASWGFTDDDLAKAMSQFGEDDEDEVTPDPEMEADEAPTLALPQGSISPSAYISKHIRAMVSYEAKRSIMPGPKDVIEVIRLAVTGNFTGLAPLDIFSVGFPDGTFSIANPPLMDQVLRGNVPQPPIRYACHFPAFSETEDEDGNSMVYPLTLIVTSNPSSPPSDGHYVKIDVPAHVPNLYISEAFAIPSQEIPTLASIFTSNCRIRDMKDIYVSVANNYVLRKDQIQGNSWYGALQCALLGMPLGPLVSYTLNVSGEIMPIGNVFEKASSWALDKSHQFTGGMIIACDSTDHEVLKAFEPTNDAIKTARKDLKNHTPPNLDSKHLYCVAGVGEVLSIFCHIYLGVQEDKKVKQAAAVSYSTIAQRAAIYDLATSQSFRKVVEVMIEGNAKHKGFHGQDPSELKESIGELIGSPNKALAALANLFARATGSTTFTPKTAPTSDKKPNWTVYTKPIMEHAIAAFKARIDEGLAPALSTSGEALDAYAKALLVNSFNPVQGDITIKSLVNDFKVQYPIMQAGKDGKDAITMTPQQNLGSKLSLTKSEVKFLPTQGELPPDPRLYDTVEEARAVGSSVVPIVTITQWVPKSRPPMPTPKERFTGADPALQPWVLKKKGAVTQKKGKAIDQLDPSDVMAMLGGD